MSLSIMQSFNGIGRIDLEWPESFSGKVGKCVCVCVCMAVSLEQDGLQSSAGSQQRNSSQGSWR